MSILRSEDMNLLKLVMQKDQEYAIIDIIGQNEMAHFVNVNEEEQSYKLPYTDMLRRCEENERLVTFVIKQCETHGIKLDKCTNIKHLTEIIKDHSAHRKTSVTGLFDLVESEVKDTEKFLRQQMGGARQMKEEANHLIEYHTVLKKAAMMIFGGEFGEEKRLSIDSSHVEMPEQQLANEPRGSHETEGSDDFLVDGRGAKNQNSLYNSMKAASESGLQQIAYLAGCINNTEQAVFEKLIFRASRGKVLTYFDQNSFTVKDYDGNEKTKTAYVLIFNEGRYIREKITRVCQSFQGKIFPLPEEGQNGPQPFRREMRELKEKIRGILNLIDMTKRQMREYLDSIQIIDDHEDVSKSYFYLQFLQREKAIFGCLNMLTRSGQIVHGYVWSPYNKDVFLEKFYGPEVSLIAEVDGHSPRQLNLQIETIKSDKLNPPTLFQTNEFTKYFQMIVDQYAVPSYKEMNPAVFTIITFPFLFGVMYGDVGHGSVLLLVATVMCLFGAQLVKANEAFAGVYEIRYMLFMMAFFAVFCGLMYNDFMAIPLNLFDSCYNATTGLRKNPDCVYPVGVDPIWYGTKQELVFLNSLKMKLSVILAIAHMTLGLVCKAFNAVYFKDAPRLLHEFLPQVILLLGVFGYMDFLIFVKWFTNYTGHTDQAPSIIVTIVNFFLNGGAIQGQEFFSHNQFVSQVLLLVAIVTIPWMLLVNPILEWQADKKRKAERAKRGGDYELSPMHHGVYQHSDEDMHHHGGVDHASHHSLDTNELLIKVIGRRKTGGHGHGEEFDLTATAIQSMIHTIEFALGTISNTASYLRLWALSLAHSQLAKVFFDMLVEPQLEKGSVAGLFITFPVWASATLFVLLIMDVMEVCLHTVRLHWVEFMSKFFQGEGYPFMVFNFRKAIEATTE